MLKLEAQPPGEARTALGKASLTALESGKPLNVAFRTSLEFSFCADGFEPPIDQKEPAE